MLPYKTGSMNAKERALGTGVGRVIEPSQVRKKARQLYAHIKERSAPKTWKSGRFKGRVFWAGAVVPYSSDEFTAWVMKTIGVNAFPCPYCGAPLDILSMVLDHDIPLRAGGTNDFSNLVPCCQEDNEWKGAMTGKGYRQFRIQLRQLMPADEADVLKRLRYGLHGMRSAQLTHVRKAKQTRTAQEETF